MKITPRILSIPPYLSVTWAQVRAIYTKEGILTVSLTDGAVISVPNLTPEEIETVFNAHSNFAADQSGRKQELPSPTVQASSPQAAQSSGKESPEGAAGPFIRFGFDNAEALHSAMQHNPALGHIPSMPKEILDKIARIAKIMAPEDIENMPKAEPHCNCPHCQIARAIHGEASEPVETMPQGEAVAAEEEVSEEDLRFRQWDIAQIGEQLYSVTNCLDKTEHYQVYLGQPVGCTCGRSGCEHVLAVLKS